MKDLFLAEIEEVSSLMTMEDIAEFNKVHCVQVIRGSDYMYGCYIDGDGSYPGCLTFLGALVYGIKAYKEKYANLPLGHLVNEEDEDILGAS